jgi:peptidoglycan/LPS O-acetylase OafA/YrhL
MSDEANPIKKASADMHIARLGTIRFLAAVWVAISHEAIPLKPFADSGLARFVLACVQDSFSGIAAVMVFFIVSGLCIHLPYSGKSRVPLVSFLVRRYLRIGAPLIAILIVAWIAGRNSEDRLNLVAWSVYAELFYYSLYPLLFRFANRWGWTVLIAISSAGAVAVALTYSDELNFVNVGWPVWVWGLPIWCSGCALADILRSGRIPSFPGSLWLWRSLAWIFSMGATWVMFHSPVKIGYQFSMLVFSPIAFLWLTRELSAKTGAWKWTESLGAASYSLYLAHPVALGALAQYGPTLAAPLDLCLRVLSIVMLTTAFYYAVEAPSHRFARKASRSVNALDAGLARFRAVR